jgi:hypothetical protein
VKTIQFLKTIATKEFKNAIQIKPNKLAHVVHPLLSFLLLILYYCLSIFVATREFSSANIDKLMRTIMCITHPLATIDELEYWAWYGVRDQESAKEKKE